MNSAYLELLTFGHLPPQRRIRPFGRPVLMIVTPAYVTKRIACPGCGESMPKVG